MVEFWGYLEYFGAELGLGLLLECFWCWMGVVGRVDICLFSDIGPKYCVSIFLPVFIIEFLILATGCNPKYIQSSPNLRKIRQPQLLNRYPHILILFMNIQTDIKFLLTLRNYIQQPIEYQYKHYANHHEYGIFVADILEKFTIVGCFCAGLSVMSYFVVFDGFGLFFEFGFVLFLGFVWFGGGFIIGGMMVGGVGSGWMCCWWVRIG